MRSNCREIVPNSAIAPGVAVAISCSLATSGSPARVNYYQYGDSNSMSRAFTALAGTEPVGDCTNAPGETTYVISGSPAGMLACYRTTSGAHVFRWSNSQLDIMAYAEDPTMAFASLKQWWQTAAELNQSDAHLPKCGIA